MADIKCTYGDFLYSIRSIEKQVIESQWKPDLILGIHRGGSVPAVYLSHIFGCPSDVMLWQTRDGLEKSHRYDIIDDAIGKQKKNVLIVDDINDSGETFQQIWDDFMHNGLEDLITEHVKFACMYQRNTSKFMAEYVANHINTSSWVFFPWENV